MKKIPLIGLFVSKSIFTEPPKYVIEKSNTHLVGHRIRMEKEPPCFSTLKPKTLKRNLVPSDKRIRY